MSAEPQPRPFDRPQRLADMANGAGGSLLFREVNGEIHRLALADDVAELEVFCECRRECHEHIAISMSEYESVRRFRGQFLVKHGHGTGTIVTRSAEFEVVEEAAG